MIKFGVRLPNSGSFAYAENVKHLALLAEELGFHSVWVHDHIIWGTTQASMHPTIGTTARSININFFESVTTLAYLAGMCETVNLGIAAIILPLRNPVILAKQLANIDVMSNSRLLLGVVPGAPSLTIPEFEAVNTNYHERGRITDEYIEVLRAIWSQHPVSFEGNYIKLKDAEILPKPSKGTIPIIIGGGEKGLSARALKRVAERGDGWLPAYLTPEEIRLGLKTIEELWRQNQRSTKPLIIHENYVFMADSQQQVVDICEKLFNATFNGVEEGIKRNLVGKTSAIISKIEEYAKAGVDIIELKFTSNSFDHILNMVKRFSEEVIPSF
ncbi:MAG: TIGR03619 family F420-dependent LLM class oxidoreductase [Candidatus Caldarchaeum sp.]